MADWYTKVGDTEEPMIFDLSDALGAVELGLPGTAVRFQMRPESNSAVKADAVAVIDPDQTANKGRVRYYFASDDVDTPGQFVGEFKVIWPDGKTSSFPNGEDYIRIEIGSGVNDKT